MLYIILAVVFIFFDGIGVDACCVAAPLERFMLCYFGSGQTCSSLSILGLLSPLDAERTKRRSTGGCLGAVQEQKGNKPRWHDWGTESHEFSFCSVNNNEGKDGL